MGNNMRQCVQVWSLYALAVITAISIANADFSDLQGRYCETRPGGCCAGRDDYCSAPIYGTLCYCDAFCNKTSQDCCPDFWSFCLGIEPPAANTFGRCYHAGQYYEYGQQTKLNCNTCKCQNIDGTDFQLVCERQECLIEPEILQSVNAVRDLGWRAANYSSFWGKTLDYGITFRTGTLAPHKTVKRMMPVSKTYDLTRIPRSFDARTKWPGFISPPNDQGWCGASWAISTAAVASDRFAIMSRGTEKVTLSAQNLLSCNDRGQQGCQGGHLSRAWMYLRKFGLVDDGCYTWTGEATKCRFPKKTTLLTARCTPLPHQHTLRTDLYKVGPAYRIKTETDIMHEIMESGPVQATMMVYQDFFSYKTGVYRKSSFVKEKFGYHSVRIIGWGEESDVYGQPNKYWLASNSWGPYWGEDGYFKIRRGNNECEIEEFVLASWAFLTEELPKHKYFKTNGNGNNGLSNTLDQYSRLKRRHYN